MFGRIRRTIGDLWRNLWVTLGNWRRGFSRRPLDYILLELFGGLPEYVPPLPWWRRFIPLSELGGATDSLSLTAVRFALERIAADPRPLGVVLRVDGITTGWGTAQSLRSIITRFQKSGKKVIVYAEEFSTMTYFVAAAADEVICPPISDWNVLGLRIQSYFVKDVFESVGLSADVLAVSPYKSAGDFVSRSDMSPESRANLNWILDGHFDEIVDAIVQGRGLDKEQVIDLIDRAPLDAGEAQEAGLIDEIKYLDAMEKYLGGLHLLKRNVRLETWGSVWRRLIRPIRRRSGKIIAVVSVEGTIVPGPSRRIPSPIPIPFIGSEQAGAETVTKSLRQAERDRRIAGLVVYVDSRGGATSASDIIWREIARIRRKKPVVVYMNNNAASGGYYVSADADWIVAQPLTVTGSIGVVWLKVAIQGLLDRIGIQSEVLQRGAHAGLFTTEANWDETQRSIISNQLEKLYSRFKEKVSHGRDLTMDQVEEVSKGQVWSGRQALEHRLVDQLGDFEDAVDKIRELAKLDTNLYTPAVWITPTPGLLLPGPIPPQPFQFIGELMGNLQEESWLIHPVDIEIK